MLQNQIPLASAGILTQVYSSLIDGGQSAPPLGATTVAGGKVYMFVQNLFTSDLAAGNIVFYDFANGYTYQVNRLGTGTTGISQMAGAANAAIPTTKYGWIQIGGVRTDLSIDGTSDVAAGDALKGVSGALSLVIDAAVATGPSYPNFVVALEAVTTNGVQTGKSGVLCCFNY